MEKSQVKDFANYEVYEIVDGAYRCLCLCAEYRIAEIIVQTLAYLDKNNDAYYITGINGPGDIVPGGGWYDCWQKDKEGKLKKHSLM